MSRAVKGRPTWTTPGGAREGDIRSTFGTRRGDQWVFVARGATLRVAGSRYGWATLTKARTGFVRRGILGNIADGVDGAFGLVMDHAERLWLAACVLEGSVWKKEV